MAEFKVIMDGDGGGDELQVAAVLLASGRVDLLGATCVFGNTDHDQVVRNTGGFLALLGQRDVAYFPGAQVPLGADALDDGDDAHGWDGKGGIELPLPLRPPETMLAADFIVATLRAEPAGSVTLIATGPLTNLAAALAIDPQAMAKVARILIMGGCTTSIPAKDLPMRQGNITPDAEFNFYMAANDARAVMNSGLPITLFPMNCTQQMEMTPARCDIMRQALGPDTAMAEKIVALMSVPAALDSAKFGAAPFLHDVHTALYLLNPALYKGRAGFVEVSVDGTLQGHSSFRTDESGTVTVMETLLHPDRAFATIAGSFRALCL